MDKVEDKIKGKVCTFLKEFTGKGPKNTQVFIKGNIIEVKAYGILTQMEKSLLEDSYNINLIKYNRELFYKNKHSELQDIITGTLGVLSIIDTIDINVLENFDNIIFKIKKE